MSWGLGVKLEHEIGIGTWEFEHGRVGNLGMSCEIVGNSSDMRYTKKSHRISARTQLREEKIFNDTVDWIFA